MINKIINRSFYAERLVEKECRAYSAPRDE